MSESGKVTSMSQNNEPPPARTTGYMQLLVSRFLSSRRSETLEYRIEGKPLNTLLLKPMSTMCLITGFILKYALLF